MEIIISIFLWIYLFFFDLDKSIFDYYFIFFSWIRNFESVQVSSSNIPDLPYFACEMSPYLYRCGTRFSPIEIHDKISIWAVWRFTYRQTCVYSFRVGVSKMNAYRWRSVFFAPNLCIFCFGIVAVFYCLAKVQLAFKAQELKQEIQHLSQGIVNSPARARMVCRFARMLLQFRHCVVCFWLNTWIPEPVQNDCVWGGRGGGRVNCCRREFVCSCLSDMVLGSVSHSDFWITYFFDH